MFRIRVFNDPINFIAEKKKGRAGAVSIYQENIPTNSLGKKSGSINFLLPHYSNNNFDI